jgi:hypothetical protein
VKIAFSGIYQLLIEAGFASTMKVTYGHVKYLENQKVSSKTPNAEVGK